MIVGITGNIGSGKSTVGKYIQSLGYLVLDSDQISRELYQRGTDCFARLVDTFGNSILDAEGTINRKKVSSIIFQDTSKKQMLEQIVHTAILDTLKERSVVSAKKIVFWEVPLLFEAGWDKEVDLVLYVSSDISTLIKRVQKRDALNESQIRERLAFQQNNISNLREQDFLIINDGSIEDLKIKVNQVLDKINHCE